MSIAICSSLLVYSENSFDRIAGNIAQSRIISGINKKWAQGRPLSGKPAPKLGLRGQKEVAVASDAIVPRFCVILLW